jgi:hypothetical protein
MQSGNATKNTTSDAIASAARGRIGDICLVVEFIIAPPPTFYDRNLFVAGKLAASSGPEEAAKGRKALRAASYCEIRPEPMS